MSDAEIRIGLGSCCVASGSEEVNKALEKAMDTAGINVKVKQVGCVGMCHNVPLLEIEKSGKIIASYAKVKPENIKPILLKHFASSSVFKRIVTSLQNKAEQFYYPDLQSTALKKFLDYREKHVNDFLQKQVHIATEHKGILNPLDIDEYISKEGFAALKNCVTETSREEIITTIIKSGLRGRGGAGFPTGEKWALFSKQQADEKYIICNADEGDPGAFMDRMLLESFPYRIIEGMMIAAYAGGATKGILYVRAEYQLAVLRMKTAIAEMVKKGMINSPLFNSQFIFNLEIFEGAGAFICGEETALIASMEGKRGMPHIRPPYPVQHGLNGKPTLVNNVETFASVPWIIRNGSTIYANIGTTFSKGTKVFALAGKIARGGLIEVPMGITIKEIVEDIGGGISGGKVFKAVQIGGPSGGCIPASLSETTIDYQSLTEAGAMMGSGGLVVLDESDCVIDIAKYFLNFTQAQSCGKCVYCRVGTKYMLSLLNKLSSGKAKMEDLQELEKISLQVKKGSLCGLGKSAPNPVLTTLKYFRDEYEAHISGICPAKKCKDLIQYEISTICIGCTKCAQNCPAEAIDFAPYEKHFIKQELCIKCDICLQVCPTGAVSKQNIKHD
ncbi:MAG: NADH dehydrogenase [Bacteroidetes bacterium RIFOXYA12_FULL_35_11]|nr:MAG: NADH dehydrogenase [Bacteroidetes bacterium GWF2_35_48]OFY80929.1 MAG: NADH dehydrogenase [Bacteroidetes bacterium RIFOXYA12_FULL_35_11]OFZ01473.1 MAG: NADH dehydrogenase [Bacteroidetes bacterium RIFOXYC12_FULL_35_7]